MAWAGAAAASREAMAKAGNYGAGEARALGVGQRGNQGSQSRDVAIRANSRNRVPNSGALINRAPSKAYSGAPAGAPASTSPDGLVYSGAPPNQSWEGFTVGVNPRDELAPIGERIFAGPGIAGQVALLGRDLYMADEPKREMSTLGPYLGADTPQTSQAYRDHYQGTGQAPSLDNYGPGAKLMDSGGITLGGVPGGGGTPSGAVNPSPSATPAQPSRVTRTVTSGDDDGAAGGGSGDGSIAQMVERQGLESAGARRQRSQLLRSYQAPGTIARPSQPQTLLPYTPNPDGTRTYYGSV